MTENKDNSFLIEINDEIKDKKDFILKILIFLLKFWDNIINYMIIII